MKIYLKEESFGKSKVDEDINTYGDCFKFVEKYIGHRPKAILICRESDKIIGFMLDDGNFYGNDFESPVSFYNYANHLGEYYGSDEVKIEGHVVKVVSGIGGEVSFVFIPKDDRGDELFDEIFENWQEFGPEMKPLQSFPNIKLSTELDFDPDVYTYNTRGKHPHRPSQFHYLDRDTIKKDPNEFDKGPLRIKATFDPDEFDENTSVNYNKVLNEGIFSKPFSN